MVGGLRAQAKYRTNEDVLYTRLFKKYKVFPFGDAVPGIVGGPLARVPVIAVDCGDCHTVALSKSGPIEVGGVRGVVLPHVLPSHGRSVPPCASLARAQRVARVAARAHSNAAMARWPSALRVTAPRPLPPKPTPTPPRLTCTGQVWLWGIYKDSNGYIGFDDSHGRKYKQREPKRMDLDRYGPRPPHPHTNTHPRTHTHYCVPARTPV